MPLKDAELRRELQKHGVKTGPITDSTRNLYVRRLEKLRKEQKTNAVTSTTNSQSEKTQTTTRTKGLAERERSKSPVLRSRRVSKNPNSSSQNAIGYSTDEDQEDRNPSMKKTTKADVPSNSRSTRQESRKSYASSKELETRSLTPVHKRVKALANNRKSASISPKRSSSLPKLTAPESSRYSDDSDDASERSSTDSWVEMESTETNTTPTLARNRNRDDIRLQKFKEEIEAWKRDEEKENPSCLSLRNISSGRRSTILQNIDQNRRTGVSSRSYGNGIPKIVTQVPEPKKSSASLIADERDGELAQNGPWTLSFSSFLPIGTCIFFIILGLLYVTMKYDPSLNSVLAINNGVQKESTDKNLEVVHMIYDHVASYAGERECGNTDLKGRLKVSQLKTELSIKEQSPLLPAFELIINNPDWGITLYDKDDSPITSIDKHTKPVFVDSEVKILSGWCRFTRAVQKVLFRIILTTAAGILIWLGLVYRRYRSEKQKEEREQMYTMVQKILDVLRRQYDASENTDGVKPFLPILHVRDMIIPPQDRKKMVKIWDRAKQFLSASETRIRVENQTIQGEDYLVWRWIQASSPASRHTPTSRVWQGEAFDIKRGPMICPTPCLKIRNVFDQAMEVGKNWIEQIQDSILEKCQGNNEILRICVEKDSKEGLVYMLCASNEAAGRAFQALHGAWFDGRLVTVKFIRLHRFHQRFPDSVNQSQTPMRPTSDVPVSTIISPQPANDTQQYEKLYPTLPGE